MRYAMPLRVADAVAVLDDLGVEPAHFLGISWGGRLDFGIGEHGPSVAGHWRAAASSLRGGISQCHATGRGSARAASELDVVDEDGFRTGDPRLCLPVGCQNRAFAPHGRRLLSSYQR